MARRSTGKAGRVIRVTVAVLFRSLRVRAYRPRHLHFSAMGAYLVAMIEPGAVFSSSHFSSARPRCRTPVLSLWSSGLGAGVIVGFRGCGWLRLFLPEVFGRLLHLPPFRFLLLNRSPDRQDESTSVEYDCDYHVDIGDIERITGFVDEGLGNMYALAL